MNSKSTRGQWQRIERELTADIEAGRFSAEMQLPTEAELMRRFGVGRHSVRRAIAQLENQGLVRVEHGRGTFLQDISRISYRLSERTRFSQNLLEQGREPFGRTLREEEIAAPAQVGEALRLPPGERVYKILRQGYADDELISFSNIYYPVRRFPGIGKARRHRGATQVLAEDYGVEDYIRLKTNILVRMPTIEEARLLGQPKSNPVVVLNKVDVDMKGVPIAYSESVWASERVQFSIDNTSQLLQVLAANADRNNED